MKKKWLLAVALFFAACTSPMLGSTILAGHGCHNDHSWRHHDHHGDGGDHHGGGHGHHGGGGGHHGGHHR